jgi:hypothetical protein
VSYECRLPFENVTQKINNKQEQERIDYVINKLQEKKENKEWEIETK